VASLSAILANDELDGTADAAAILGPNEAMRAGQFTCLMVCMLTDRQSELFGDAVIADWFRRQSRYEFFDIVQDGHIGLYIQSLEIDLSDAGRAVRAIMTEPIP
jgi:hypothetical protein